MTKQFRPVLVVLSLASLLLPFLAGCGKYEKEQIISPANFTTDRNALYNSNFEIWQRGTEIDVSNNQVKYGPDRWYVSNSLGEGSTIHISRALAVSEGSRYAVQVHITQAPTNRESNGCTLSQTLDRIDSAQFYNKKASAYMKVRGIKNVSKVGIQFMINQTEAKAESPIGSEAIFEVNEETATAVFINNELIGKEMTPDGVLGVRLRIVGVKEGSTFDRGNGMLVEQAIVSAAPFTGTYLPKYASFADEYRNCLRFYEKSYSLNTPPGTLTLQGAEGGLMTPGMRQWDNLTGLTGGPVRFNERKRIVPKLTIYTTAGQLVEGHWTNHSAGDTLNKVDVKLLNERGFAVGAHGVGANSEASYHWVADAEI